MAWELNVPKILHVYWGGSPLSYIRFMTVKSFMKYNPDWEVRLYYPVQPNTNITWGSGENEIVTEYKDYLPELMDLPITKFPVDFRRYGFNNDMPEVHKSDFIRLEQLSTVGGVWSDMDVLYFKPMDSLYLNIPVNKHARTFYCNHIYGHSIGFLMSSGRNDFFRTLVKISKKEYHPGSYQAIGVIIWNRYFREEAAINIITPAINFDMNVVYSYDARYISEILEPSNDRFTEKSIGIHWYGGHPMWGNFIKETNGGSDNLPDNLIGNLLKEMQ